MDNSLWLIGSVLVIATILAVALSSVRQAFTVFEYQRALLFRKGQFEAVLGPGRHAFWGGQRSVQVIDIRLTMDHVGNQEILTLDGVSLRLSATAEYAVEDPKLALLGAQQFQTSAYSVVHSALRDAVGPLSADQSLERRAELSDWLTEHCKAKFATLGLRLDRAEIRDITFPGDLKKVFGQVVLAQKEALAALERARGETAALRSLANAAKLLENNPSLMQLRILQSLGEAKGATIVLDMSGRGVLPTASTE